MAAETLGVVCDAAGDAEADAAVAAKGQGDGSLNEDTVKGGGGQGVEGDDLSEASEGPAPPARRVAFAHSGGDGSGGASAGASSGGGQGASAVSTGGVGADGSAAPRRPAGGASAGVGGGGGGGGSAATSIFTSAAARRLGSGGGGGGAGGGGGKLRGPLKRLHKELVELQALAESSGGAISGSPRGDDFYNWVAVLRGPEGTPYEGGRFEVDVSFPADYPFKPPKVHFKTRVYHCNITASGICMDVLKDSWSPRVTIAKVLMEVMSLLADPSPSTPLDGAIAKAYLDDREAHDKTAREWTQRYAAGGGAAAGES